MNPHFSQKLRNLSFTKYIFSIFVNLSDREISSNKVQTERLHLKINFIYNKHANVILSKTFNYCQAALIWYKIIKPILTKKEESNPTKLQASTLQINTIIF